MPKDPLVSFRGDRAKLPLPIRALGRYLVTGDPLRGPGDNSTFLHAATVDYRARPYITLTAARWKRLARRHAALTLPLALLVAAPWAGLWPLIAWALVTPAAALTWLTWRTITGIRDHRRNKRYVDPAARALHAALGHRYAKRAARECIQIPRDWKPGTSAEPIRVSLPGDKPLSAVQQRALVTAVAGRLGIVDAKGSWFNAGPVRTVDIAGQPLPPEDVTLDALMEAIEAAPLTRPVVGMGPAGILNMDYEQDSPHVACSGPAGTGKTTLFRFIASQRIRKGAGAIFLDAKRWSHRWAHRLPDHLSQYWFRPADIHDSLVAVGGELDRRINCDEQELGTFRTVDVYIEEANSLIKILTRYWQGERKRIVEHAKELREMEADYDPADLDPPALSPAVAALQYGVFMGRELQMHFHVMSQKLEANVFGSNSGGAVRDSFQIRFMAQWDRALWKMLASGHEYVAWPGGKRGLWGVVLGNVFQIFRAPNVSNNEAYKLATTGVPMSGPVLGGQDRTPVVDVPVDRPAVVQAVRLSDAVDKLPAGQDGTRLSLAALRWHSRRPGFPESIGSEGRAHLYDLSELIYWREGALQLES